MGLHIRVRPAFFRQGLGAHLLGSRDRLGFHVPVGVVAPHGHPHFIPLAKEDTFHFPGGLITHHGDLIIGGQEIGGIIHVGGNLRGPRYAKLGKFIDMGLDGFLVSTHVARTDQAFGGKNQMAGALGQVDV